MSAFHRLMLVAALTIGALATSCQEYAGNAESCAADAHVDVIESSQLNLLQSNLVVQPKYEEPTDELGRPTPVVVKEDEQPTDEQPTDEAETTVPAGTKMVPVAVVKREPRETDPTPAPDPAAVEAPASSPNATTPGGKCTPTCSWKCATAVCDEVCTPSCQAPRCQTRCNGMNTTGCKMNCEEPSCAVVCPERGCAAQTCHACTTNCSKPMCKLNCSDVQDCTEVCETPVCNWDCKAPEKCPKPECHMECEKPRVCMGQDGDTLPDIQPGQTVIRDFETPLSLMQWPIGDTNGSPTLPVKVLKAVSVPGSDEVKLIESIVDIAVA